MIIIHGENALESSKRLSLVCEEAKAKGLQVVFFDQTELTLGKLRQELSSADLFGNTNFLVIRGLLSGTKSKNKDKIIDFLKNSPSPNVLLFEPKSVHPSTAKQFKGATVENFKIEVNIFKFLEKLAPNNTQNLLASYSDLLQKKMEPEFVFAMVVRQVRLMIQLKTSPQLVKLPPFSIKSLQSQATRFTLESLLSHHESLYQIERGIKSGKNPLDLNNLLLHFLEQL